MEYRAIASSGTLSRRAIIAAALAPCGMARRMRADDARIETVIGNGAAGRAHHQVANPYGLVIGPDGALYFCEIDNHQIRRLDLRTGKTSVVAGTREPGSGGDGGAATQAALREPYELRFDRRGDLYFVDMPSHVVRRIDARRGTIHTVAGTGEPGFAGDGGPAIRAQLRNPHSIAFDPDGRLVICDIGNHRVRRVDLATGRIETWLGTGEKLSTPDDAPIDGAPFHGPRAIDFGADGSAYLALREGNSVFAIHPTQGRARRIAGTGEKGYSGDGGPALAATLNGPKGIAVSPGRKLYLADTENHVIRRIHLASGIIDTVAGSGKRGDGPDGDPLRAKMNRPHGVFAAADGALYIGDSEAHRIRVLRSGV
jgi:sugar lactone lactonase YvrE